MSDEFDGFDDPRMGNPWLRYGILSLNFVGAAYILLGLVGGPGYGWIFTQDPNMGLIPGILVGTFMFLICLGIGIANVVAAALLGRKNKIGWIMGLILGGLYCTSCCAPFGVVILVGLLQDKSRKIYLG